MDIFLIILGIVAVGAGVLIYLQKTGKVKDADGDLIPDAIEEKVEEVKAVAKEVKARAKNVAKETKEVVAAAKNVAKEAGDVVKAAKGTKKPAAKKTTTRRKPAAKK